MPKIKSNQNNKFNNEQNISNHVVKLIIELNNDTQTEEGENY